MAKKTSRIPRNLNFLGETAFLGGIFCLEYPSRCSEKVNCHFLNYRLSFCKLQILIWQTADSHFANYRFSFRKLQIYISQTTDFHFANYRFSFRFVPFRFVSFRFAPFRFAPFRFANYSKPLIQWKYLTCLFLQLQEFWQNHQISLVCNTGAVRVTMLITIIIQQSLLEVVNRCPFAVKHLPVV